MFAYLNHFLCNIYLSVVAIHSQVTQSKKGGILLKFNIKGCCAISSVEGDL